MRDEIREKRAASAGLGIKMSHIWDRHVIAEIEVCEPFQVAVENCGAESGSTIVLAILVDEFGPAQKLFSIGVEVAIVVQILHGDFESTIRNASKVCLRDRIAFFRNYLKRRLNLEESIDFHKFLPEIPPASLFHV